MKYVVNQTYSESALKPSGVALEETAGILVHIGHQRAQPIFRNTNRLVKDLSPFDYSPRCLALVKAPVIVNVD